MIGTKERKKQNGDTTVSVKNRNNDPGFNHNPCGGCNACYQMTGIHNKTGSPTWGGTGDGEKGPNLQRPCATNFFQRNLGNNAMQAIAVSRQTSGQATSGGGTAVIQRKCAYGGSCASCGDKEEELMEIQPKLTIGPSNDVYEEEADRVADAVMRMSDSSPKAEDDQSHAGISIQRVKADVSDTLNFDPDMQLNQGGGQPLSSSTRQFMEPRFGVDFGHVRLHVGQDAHRTAAQIHARAFTYGHHIGFGKGESEQDTGLMAHELTHVVQQGAAFSADRIGSAGVSKNMAAPQVQRARLPCTSRKTIDVYAVNLPGSTRTIYDDLPNANAILCQCGVELKVAGGESWDTNLMDSLAPIGVLNEYSSVGSPTDEEVKMLAHQPSGKAVHVYYVPSLSRGSEAEAFWPSGFPTVNQGLAVGNSARACAVAHELGHILLNDGSHRDAKPDNLMASGSVNTCAGELEQDQCNRMP